MHKRFFPYEILRNVIHRDIKPENIIAGRDGEQCLLYLVDFGISKFYKEDSEHMF